MNRDALLDNLPERRHNEMAIQRLEEQMTNGGGVVPFVGAGLSIPFGYPGWTDFLRTCAEQRNLAPQVAAYIEQGQYEEAAELLEDSYGSVRFQDTLYHTFGPSRIAENPIAGAMSLLPLVSRGPVITTNFDSLLQSAFTSAGAGFEQLIWGSSIELGRRAFREQRRLLLKLHGDASDPTDRVLTRRDYDRHYGNSDDIDLSRNLPRLLCDILNMYRLLFLGCSLRLDRTVSILKRLNSTNTGSKHFAIVARPETDEATRAMDLHLGAHGIMPIWLPTGRFDQVPAILEHLADIAGHRRQHSHPIQARGNLPLARPRFIGRASLCEHIRRQSTTHRLVTLVGAGGCGKTRLAEEVGDQVRTDFQEVWLVPLASKTDKASVSQEIAVTLRIAEQAQSPPREALIACLSDRNALIILDNCEHVIDSCREIVDEILASCPRTHILATSREVLNTEYDEVVKWIGGLHQPSHHDVHNLQRLRNYEAVQLFELRGSAVADFHINPTNAAAVVQICRRLDGIPLNLELAAARLDTLSPMQIAANLNQCLKLLANNRKRGRKEHMSVAETIQWSYDLLAQEEQELVRRLAVFEGVWTWDTAHTICAPEADKFETNARIGQLVRKSMIAQCPPASDGKKRLFLLETIQQFGLGQMTEPELTEVRERHCTYLLARMENRAGSLANAPDDRTLDEIEQERADLMAALQWSIASNNRSWALRLGAAMWRYWELRGHFAEGRALLEPLLEIPHIPEASAARGQILTGTGLLAYRQGDVRTARIRFLAALELERTRQDPERIAMCLCDMGIVSFLEGYYQDAADYYRQSLQLKHHCNPRTLGVLHFNAGGLELAIGNIPEAILLLQQSLELFQRVGNKSEMAYAHTALAHAAVVQNDSHSAFEHLRLALSYRRTLGHIRGLAETLNGLGFAALRSGDSTAARRYLLKSLTRIRQVKDNRGLADAMDNVVLYAAANSRLVVHSVRLSAAVDEFRRRIGIPRRPLMERIHDEQRRHARESLAENEYRNALLKGKTDDEGGIESLARCILAK